MLRLPVTVHRSGLTDSIAVDVKTMSGYFALSRTPGPSMRACTSARLPAARPGSSTVRFADRTLISTPSGAVGGNGSAGNRRPNDVIVRKGGEQTGLVDENRQRRTLDVDRMGFSLGRCRRGDRPERQRDGPPEVHHSPRTSTLHRTDCPARRVSPTDDAAAAGGAPRWPCQYLPIGLAVRPHRSPGTFPPRCQP